MNAHGRPTTMLNYLVHAKPCRLPEGCQGQTHDYSIERSCSIAARAFPTPTAAIDAAQELRLQGNDCEVYREEVDGETGETLEWSKVASVMGMRL